MRFLFYLILSLSTFSASAQVQLKIEIRSLPRHHPSNAAVYIAGSFNGWNPADEAYRFQRARDSSYYILLTLAAGNYEYKVTRGGWDKVECNKNGSAIENRTLKAEKIETITIDVAEWQDRLPPKPRKSTASPNVMFIDSAFVIPQLKRIRGIWIYLPADYFKVRTNYPVLYMHDGQNLFDDSTSFSGEWGIDDYLDTTRNRKCIIVGINHGGDKRLNEYNPYNHQRFGKGEGDLYVDFVAKTLKPFIDKNYRTKKDRESTWIAGSSMGGLISLYAALKYPKTFGGAGIFSPAFWVAPAILNDIRKKGHEVKSAIYFYAGKHESDEMVTDMLKAFGEMRKVSKSKMVTVIRDEGKHNEATWKKEFPLFYSWLINNSRF
jgi:predicted alpha/beta superfamily hydrolase